MCIYVKFGVGWALHKKGAYAYLSNALTSKCLYSRSKQSSDCRRDRQRRFIGKVI